jgi:thioredoxin 1
MISDRRKIVMNTKATGYNPNYSETLQTLEQLSEIKGHFLLEFGAPWCGHCQAASVAVKEVMNEKLELPHIKIYDGKGKKLGRSFAVKLWPTFILINEGQEIARIVRPTNADELRKLIQH